MLPASTMRSFVGQLVRRRTFGLSPGSPAALCPPIFVATTPVVVSSSSTDAATSPPSVCARPFSKSTSPAASGPFPEKAQEKHVFDGKPVILDSSKHAVGYLSNILNARVYDIVKETALEPAVSLSAELQNDVLLKREVSGPDDHQQHH